MNRETLLKLKKNPFYKFTAQQKAELDEIEGNNERMIAFGDPTLHNQYVPTHDVKLGRKKRKCK